MTIRVVAVGGTTKPDSSTDRALRAAARAVTEQNCHVDMFDGQFLKTLPMYDPLVRSRTTEEQRFIDAVRKCDAMIIASPGYHGGVSALVKNAIDLLEETANDRRVYIEGVPVGLIVTAYGWQATGTTLAALRAIVHALRGWPTPVGIVVNSLIATFDSDSLTCSDAAIARQIKVMARQLLGAPVTALTNP